MGFSVHKNGFTKLLGTNSVGGLGFDLMTELAKSMTLVFPSTLEASTPVAIFDSAIAMDPLHEDQPWRLRIEVGTAGGSNEHMRIHAGTHHQIPDNGSEPSREAEATRSTTSGTGSNQVTSYEQIPLTSGNFIGMSWPTGENEPKTPEDKPFLYTGLLYADSDPEAGPLTYRLSVSDHGIAFCVWKDAYDDAGDKFAWFVIQRPVDPNTGETLVDGYSPVFAAYSAGGGGSVGSSINALGIRKFVVRQSDVLAPTKSVSAVVASEDSNPIMNPLRQVAISVDNKYMITFPAGLNTPKRAYKHELDMIAYTSSDVISQDSDVDITVFSEAAPRKYKAMNANGQYNTGMRILLLVEGGGIPVESVEPAQ